MPIHMYLRCTSNHIPTFQTTDESEAVEHLEENPTHIIEPILKFDVV